MAKFQELVWVKILARKRKQLAGHLSAPDVDMFRSF
jgi:hypothetical protein